MALPEGLVGDLQAILDERIEAGLAPGATLTVVVPGHLPLDAVHGIADVGTGAPVSPNARLRIGSITKVFVAVVVLQLVAEGRLSLDDPLDLHVAGFDLGDEVTIERLLNHTSGIYSYTDDGTFLAEAAEEATPAEVVQWALDHGPAFAPGAEYGYSNTNYFLLGMVVEAVDGPLHEVIRARILTPLSLDDTFLEGAEPGDHIPGHLAGIALTGPFSVSWAWASGGMVSTGRDLCAFLDAVLRTDLLLDAESRALMQADTVVGGVPSGYGLGLRLAVRAERAVLGHTGSTMGFDGEAFLHPETGACLVVLTNDFFGAHEDVAKTAWARLFTWLDDHMKQPPSPR